MNLKKKKKTQIEKKGEVAEVADRKQGETGKTWPFTQTGCVISFCDKIPKIMNKRNQRMDVKNQRNLTKVT